MRFDMNSLIVLPDVVINVFAINYTNLKITKCSVTNLFSGKACLTTKSGLLLILATLTCITNYRVSNLHRTNVLCT